MKTLLACVCLTLVTLQDLCAAEDKVALIAQLSPDAHETGVTEQPRAAGEGGQLADTTFPAGVPQIPPLRCKHTASALCHEESLQPVRS